MAVYFTQAGVGQLTTWLKTPSAPTGFWVNWATAVTSGRSNTTMTEGTESRVAATLSSFATTFTNDTFQAQATQTCNATGKTILAAGLFWLSSGTALFMEGDFTSGIAVVTGDQIMMTFQIQFT